MREGRGMRKLVSTLPAVFSTSSGSARTEKETSTQDFNGEVSFSSTFVCDNERACDSNLKQVVEVTEMLSGRGNNYVRKYYSSLYKDLILAKFRINDVFVLKLMSEAINYARNPLKQFRVFPRVSTWGDQ